MFFFCYNLICIYLSILNMQIDINFLKMKQVFFKCTTQNGLNLNALRALTYTFTTWCCLCVSAALFARLIVNVCVTALLKSALLRAPLCIGIGVSLLVGSLRRCLSLSFSLLNVLPLCMVAPVLFQVALLASVLFVCFAESVALFWFSCVRSLPFRLSCVNRCRCCAAICLLDVLRWSD